MDIESTLAIARQRMVAQLQAMGITSLPVLAAMGAVARHRFVPRDEWPIAYADRALPIGDGQTISQPYIVARMAELLALDGTARVLDVGTGSGYAAAVYARLARQVVSIERLAELAQRARTALAALHIENVTVLEGDGSNGFPPEAPYDAIAVAAAAPDVPPPLREQLAEGGRLVLPIGEVGGVQQLVRITRHGDEFPAETIGDVVFVPLRGRHGWSER